MAGPPPGWCVTAIAVRIPVMHRIDVSFPTQRSFAAFITLFTVAAALAFTPAAQAGWLSDPDEAFTQAKAENKPVLIYLYHPLSLKKDAPVFSNALVSKYLVQFIMVQINIDSHGEYADRFDVESFPTVLMFDSQGRELLPYRYENEDLKRTRLTEYMKQALKNIEEFSLIESEIDRFQDKPEFMIRYARGLRDRGEFGKADSILQKVIDSSSTSAELKDTARETQLSLLILQATRHFYSHRYDQCIDLLQRVVAKAKDGDLLNQTKYFLGMAYWEAGDKRKGESILKKMSGDSKAGIFQDMAKRYMDEKNASG
ncbi:MAG: hypothetical protein GC154_17445 [bacterium]|nr:hypothetical protein [bacterium]